MATDIINEIKEYTDDIRNRIYGSEVRGAISDGMDALAENLQNAVDNQITELGDFFSIKRPSSASATGKYDVSRGSINDSGVRSPNSGNETSCITKYITLTTPVIIKLDNNDGGSLSINRVRGYLNSGSTYTPESTWIANGDLSPTKSIFIKPSETRTHICVSFKHLDGSAISDTEIDQLIDMFAVYKETDAELETEGVPADAAATGGRIAEVETDVNFLFSQNDTAVEVYSTFEDFSGWYRNDGTIDDTANKHTQLLPIRGGQRYYFSYAFGTSCNGAFFDRQMNWIAPLRGSTSANPDVTAISASYTGGDNTYLPDNAALDETSISKYPASMYAKIYTFVAPSNAAYFSLNGASAVNAQRYRQFVSSKPIFILNGSGNYILRESDVIYQQYKDKKVCIIGPSNVMINRLLRTNANGDSINPTTTTAYIAGFQEYLKPWFAEVRGMGYSGAAYAYGRGSATGVASIYTQICGGTESFTKDGEDYSITVTAPDLSGYDIFLLSSDHNGLTVATVGEFTDSDNTSYCGAINLICDKILEQNPKAEIYVSNFGLGTTHEVANPAERYAANEQLSLLAKNRGLRLIDLGRDGGTTEEGVGYYRYDGKHANNIGNRRTGLSWRKAILGF